MIKKEWFEKFSCVSVGVLNSSKDSSSSTQANLAHLTCNKNILIIDGVGYHWPLNTERDDDSGGDNKSKEHFTADVKGAPSSSYSSSFSVHDDTAAVSEQINSAMTKFKLKICSKDCDDIMSAWSNDNNNTKKKRKLAQQNSGGDNLNSAAVATITDSAWLMEKTVFVKAFANNVVW